jgi:hypothetical protein
VTMSNAAANTRLVAHTKALEAAGIAIKLVVRCSVPGPTLNLCGYRDGRPTLLSPRGVSPGAGRAVIRAAAGHDPRVLFSVPGPTLNLHDLRDGRRAVVSPWSVRPGTARATIRDALT